MNTPFYLSDRWLAARQEPDSSSTSAPYFYLLLSASWVLLFRSITFGLVVYVPVVRRYPLRLAQKKKSVRPKIHHRQYLWCKEEIKQNVKSSRNKKESHEKEKKREFRYVPPFLLIRHSSTSLLFHFVMFSINEYHQRNNKSEFHRT